MFPCSGPNSPVEFEILLEKITIQQLNSLSYTEFSEEYEEDPCQVVSFGEKKLKAVFEILFVFICKGNK